MKREEEPAWRMTRSAEPSRSWRSRSSASRKPRGSAIIEALDQTSVDALTEWLQTGRSSFAGHIEKQWRLRRDSGMD